MDKWIIWGKQSSTKQSWILYPNSIYYFFGAFSSSFFFALLPCFCHVQYVTFQAENKLAACAFLPLRCFYHRKKLLNSNRVREELFEHKAADHWFYLWIQILLRSALALFDVTFGNLKVLRSKHHRTALIRALLLKHYFVFSCFHLLPNYKRALQRYYEDLIWHGLEKSYLRFILI